MKAFADGLEHNSLTPYSSSTQTGSWTVAASSANPHTGTHHLRSSWDGVTAGVGFVARDFGSSGGALPTQHYTDGSKRYLIETSKAGECHISFWAASDLNTAPLVVTHKIFEIATTSNTIFSLTFLKSGTNRIASVSGGSGSVNFPTNMTSGAYYRFYIKVKRISARGAATNSSGYVSCWMYDTDGETELGYISLPFIRSEAVFKVNLGRIAGLASGGTAAERAINIDIDDISINDDQGTIHIGDPGATQVKTFDEPASGTPTFSEWNTTGTPREGEVTDSSDSTYIDTDLGNDLPRRETFIMPDFDDNVGADAPLAITIMIRVGPDAGSAPLFHDLGIYDGTAKHATNISIPTSLSWMLLTVGEKRGGGALDKSYIDGSEYWVSKVSNFIDLNDAKVTELMSWVEDDNAVTVPDYSDFDQRVEQGSVV